MSRITPWGRELRDAMGAHRLDRSTPAPVPLPEYPRPQLARESYRNLNGLWDYAITRSATPPAAWQGEILVPFPPESELSGVGRMVRPHDHLWYRRRLHIEPEFNVGRVWLHFGAVDQLCEIAVDGRVIARHQGGFLPFRVDVTNFADGTDHVLTVHVRDCTDRSYLARGKQSLTPSGIWYTPHSGIWQTVWLESVPDTAIEGLVVRPHLAAHEDEGSPQAGFAGAIELEVATSHPADVTVVVYAPPGGAGEPQEVARASSHTQVSPAASGSSPTARLRPGGNPRSASEIPTQPTAATALATATVRIEIPDAQPWTPENPALYGLEVIAGADRVTSYAALRTVELGAGANGMPTLLLNGAPYFHAGVLDQGYWPESLVTPPADAAMEWDIATMKSLGYTMLRKHIKIEPLRWYYHADRLGMLVWQDAVNGGGRYNRAVIQVPAVMTAHVDDSHHHLFARANAHGREDFERELAEMIALLRNSPSIVVWVPFNEGWGQFDAARIAGEVAAADPSRIVDHASGWHDQGAGDITSPHIYFRMIKPHPEWGADGRAVVLSEYGGYALRIPGHEFSRKEFGYKRLKTAAELTAAWQRLHRSQIIPAVRAGLAGFVYTQLSDVEDELNGLVTADRTVIKVDADVQRATNAQIRAEFAAAVGGVTPA